MATWNTLRNLQGAYNGTPALPPTDLPTQDEIEADALVVLRAMIDQQFARKKDQKTAWATLYVSKPYNIEMMRLAAWSIVTETANAASGIRGFLPGEEAKEPVYQPFAGYMLRLVVVIKALRLDKGVVK
ncbi:hypothetical protein GGR57DRAFT_498212 [Xylariaceae sp. FL1272]|nr:hypothetical protein GGR57DRAFT_498212 [Xylariaceae sp. FL1272]